MGMGDWVKCGTPFSRATPEIASELGVMDEPTSTSTLSSVTSRRALVVALPGSEASSSRMTVTFSPAISLGNSSVKVFLAGTPRAEAGPVAAMLTPTLTSASAACGRTSATAAMAATRQLVDGSFISGFPPGACLLAGAALTVRAGLASEPRLCGGQLLWNITLASQPEGSRFSGKHRGRAAQRLTRPLP